MEISELYQLFRTSGRVTTDTRNIPLGSIYFALRGDRFNGNVFANNALEGGASFAVVDDPICKNNDRIILVDSVLLTLQQLATFHRRVLGVPILGITGTNGKTTTKELIRCVLSSKYQVWATQGNLNNHIGVPLTLLSMNENTEIGIVEMGANHPLEIKQLCEIAEPDMGIITNIGKAHLEGFGGFEGVRNTKKELFDYVENKQGMFFFNSDNCILSEMLSTSNISSLSYGPQTGTYCRGNAVSDHLFLRVEVSFGDSKIIIPTQLVGDYNLENVLAAFAVGLKFNIPPSEIGDSISKYNPDNSRSQLFSTFKNKLLLDCYNANPSSLEVAILNFVKVKEINKVIILGDMLELGVDSDSEHLRILNLVSQFSECKVFVVGPRFKVISEPFNVSSFENSDELREFLINNPIEGSFMLIKGSRGIKLERIVDVL